MKLITCLSENLKVVEGLNSALLKSYEEIRVKEFNELVGFKIKWNSVASEEMTKEISELKIAYMRGLKELILKNNILIKEKVK